MATQDGNETNGDGAQRRTVRRRRRRRGRRGSGSTTAGVKPAAPKEAEEEATVSETAETISRIESDSAASRAEAETKPPITPMPRRIDELGEVGVVILGDHKPSPCSRFVLKEYFD